MLNGQVKGLNGESTLGENLPVLDAPVLAKLRRDVGDESANFLVESLRKEIRSGQTSFRGFADAGDLKQLETQAHALKSAARSFGALKLGEACLALEESAKAEQGAEVIAGLLATFSEVSSETLAAFEGV